MQDKTQKSTALRFRPLIDWWILVFVSLIILMFVALIPTALWLAQLPLAMTLVVVFIAILAALYYIDLAFYSVYVLEKDGLHIVSNLRHVLFPYREMRAIKPGGFKALVSFGTHKRFALASKNVIIKLSEGHWRTISVSPERKDDFIHAILEKIDSDRSNRSSRVS